MSPPVFADPSHLHAAADHYLYPTVFGEVLRPNEPSGVELTERGRHLRGVYIPVGRVSSWGSRKIVQWVKQVGADAVVLDIKDDRGRVTFSKRLKGAKGYPHGVVPNMERLVRKLKEADIYTIGRLVCFKDNVFYHDNRSAVIRDRRTGRIWRDHAGMIWLDPFSSDVHEYIASIALAAQKIGFDEIQLDYVRFPVSGVARYAKYPNQENNMARYEAIAALLARVDHRISLPLSIDVFGLTSLKPGDREGLGQSLEHLAPYIDAISPMLYLANWPRQHWENPTTKKVHALVHNAVKRIRFRLGDTIAVRPLLQGFRYRAENFGVGFIQTQIDAAQTAGSSGHLFWNQSGNYGKVSTAWRLNEAAEPSAREGALVQ